MSSLLTDKFLFFAKKHKKKSQGDHSASLLLVVLWEFHDNLISVHFDCSKTFSKVANACYFCKYENFVNDILKPTNRQRINYQNQLLGKFLNIISVKMQLQAGMDLIGSYPS